MHLEVGYNQLGHSLMKSLFNFAGRDCGQEGQESLFKWFGVRFVLECFIYF